MENTGVNKGLYIAWKTALEKQGKLFSIIKDVRHSVYDVLHILNPILHLHFHRQTQVCSLGLKKDINIPLTGIKYRSRVSFSRSFSL